MFSCRSAAFARPSGAYRAFAQDGSKRLKKAQKGAKGLKKALERKRTQKGARRGCSSLPCAASAPEEAVRACFGAACAFEEAVRDCCARSLFENAGLGYTVL